MSAKHTHIPASFPVRPLKPGQRAGDRVTCGTCGLSWDDSIPTGYTPAPSGRCPFEAFHKEERSGRKGRVEGHIRQKKTLANGWVLTWDSNQPDKMSVDDEKSGSWSDNALLVKRGKIVYDFPERVPEGVRAAVSKFFYEMRTKAHNQQQKLAVGTRVKGAPGLLHEPLTGVVEWSRGASVRVRWDDGGSLTGPAHAFVPVAKSNSKGRAAGHGSISKGRAAGRARITRFYVEERKGGPSAVALDARGHVVNLINGDKSETLATVIKAARTHWKGARFIEKPEFRPGPGGRYVAVGRTKSVSTKGLAKGKTERFTSKLGRRGMDFDEWKAALNSELSSVTYVDGFTRSKVRIRLSDVQPDTLALFYKKSTSPSVAAREIGKLFQEHEDFIARQPRR